MFKMMLIAATQTDSPDAGWLPHQCHCLFWSVERGSANNYCQIRGAGEPRAQWRRRGAVLSLSRLSFSLSFNRSCEQQQQWLAATALRR